MSGFHLKKVEACATISIAGRSSSATCNKAQSNDIDLQKVIKNRFNVVYSERAISDLLKVSNFPDISARPQNPDRDEQVIEAFKKTSPERSLPV